MRFSMSAIIYWQNPCKLPMNFRCIKAWMLAFSRRFSRKCLEGISFNFFVCFIFHWSIGSAPKKKNHKYLTLYQNWNRTQVYFELAANAISSFFFLLLLSFIFSFSFSFYHIRERGRGKTAFSRLLSVFICLHWNRQNRKFHF